MRLLFILHVLAFSVKHQRGVWNLAPLPGGHQLSCFEEINGKEEDWNATVQCWYKKPSQHCSGQANNYIGSCILIHHPACSGKVSRASGFDLRRQNTHLPSESDKGHHQFTILQKQLCASGKTRGNLSQSRCSWALCTASAKVLCSSPVMQQALQAQLDAETSGSF